VFLFVCVLGNAVSIFWPMPIASGTLKPAQPSVKKFLVHFLAMMLIPMALLPAAAAIGCEYLVEWLLDGETVPVYLLASMIEAGLLVWLYRSMLRSQGRWLQQRETRILESVSTPDE